jgi:hypothetical protein
LCDEFLTRDRIGRSFRLVGPTLKAVHLAPARGNAILSLVEEMPQPLAVATITSQACVDEIPVFMLKLVLVLMF